MKQGLKFIKKNGHNPIVKYKVIRQAWQRSCYKEPAQKTHNQTNNW